MSKLLITSDSSWYDELNSVSFYGETEFQRALQQHISQIFHEYYAFPFSKTIKSKLGSSKPDLGLISKDLKEWWIIEVELGKHSLENHVLVQIDNFRHGTYPVIIFAEYFKSKIFEHYNIHVSETKIKKLLTKQTPEILVVVDEDRQDWQAELKKRHAKLCLFQIFKNGRGSHAYRLHGGYPYISIDESHLKPDKYYGSNLLEVKNAKFILKKTGYIAIGYNGLQTKWKKITDKKKTFIRFIGKINPLPPNSTFNLIRDSNKRLVFIKN